MNPTENPMSMEDPMDEDTPNSGPTTNSNPTPDAAARRDDGTGSTGTARSFEGLVWDLKAESSSDGGSDSASFATSMTDSATEFKYEHGRRYHAYENLYPLPNDDKEVQRLELQHMIWSAVFNQRLSLAPLPEGMTDAIDFGCGTGAWAIEFANAHPNCRIVGTDLSPIQPEYIPANCSFLIDDANHAWPSDWAAKLDYIHTRAIGMGVSDWERFVSQSYTGLKPSGWLELQEFHIPFGCDDGTVLPGSALNRWGKAFLLGASKIGVDVQAGLKHANRMRNHAFVRVREMKLKIPIGPWCKGKREKVIGQLALQDLHENIEGLSTKILSVAGLSRDEILKLCDEVKAEWMNPRIHTYMPLDISWGQKPPSSKVQPPIVPATSSEALQSTTGKPPEASAIPAMPTASGSTAPPQTDDMMGS